MRCPSNDRRGLNAAGDRCGTAVAEFRALQWLAFKHTPQSGPEYLQWITIQGSDIMSERSAMGALFAAAAAVQWLAFDRTQVSRQYPGA